MRKKLLPLACVLLMSCHQNEVVEEINPGVDSVILKSQIQLETSAEENKKADSTVKVKTQKIAEKIAFLTREISIFKTEREKLLEEVKSVSSKVVYKVDTVYIESKKNFWGKTKTSTSVKSDSTVSENESTEKTQMLKVDSTIVQKIDTININ